MWYKDWLDEWLDNYIRPTSKLKTFIRYSEIVDQHIRPKLGDMDMDDISPAALQRFITALTQSGNVKTGKGLAANSVNAVITVVQSSLKVAFDFGHAVMYTADKIKRPKPKERKVECFSLDEQKKIERYILQADKPNLIGIILGFYSGLRIGELLALEWSDIDFDRGMLFVSKTCFEAKDDSGKFGRITDAPKTQASVRSIPLPEQLFPALCKVKRSYKSQFVVSNNGKPVSVRSYQRIFERILKRLNIPRRGFHSIRHTFATRALECGMDVKTLSEILGHKNPTVTLSRYVHSLPDYKKEMMNKLGKLF